MPHCLVRGVWIACCGVSGVPDVFSGLSSCDWLADLSYAVAWTMGANPHGGLRGLFVYVYVVFPLST